jgi:hypothetical protein
MNAHREPKTRAIMLVALVSAVGWLLGVPYTSSDEAGAQSLNTRTNEKTPIVFPEDSSMTGTVSTAESGRPFRILTDPKTKHTVAVDPAKRVVTLKDTDGKTIWSVDVLSKAKVPFVGRAEIREIKINDGSLLVVIGKHSFVNIDMKTGTVSILGSD